MNNSRMQLIELVKKIFSVLHTSLHLRRINILDN